MMILVRLCFAILVIFSYANAFSSDSFADKLYKEELKKLNRDVAQRQRNSEMFKRFSKTRPEHKDHYLSASRGELQHKKKAQKKYDDFKKEYAKNPKKVINQLYKSKKSHLIMNVNWAKRVSKHNSRLKKKLIQYEKDLKKFDDDYKGYLAKEELREFLAKKSKPKPKPKPTRTNVRFVNKPLNQIKTSTTSKNSSFAEWIKSHKTTVAIPSTKSNSQKTTLQKVNIKTTAKVGDVNTKGNLSVANVKIKNGSTLKDTNINADVKTKNISVSKGSSADIGSVNINK